MAAHCEQILVECDHDCDDDVEEDKRDERRRHKVVEDADDVATVIGHLCTASISLSSRRHKKSKVIGHDSQSGRRRYSRR